MSSRQAAIAAVTARRRSQEPSTPVRRVKIDPGDFVAVFRHEARKIVEDTMPQLEQFHQAGLSALTELSGSPNEALFLKLKQSLTKAFGELQVIYQALDKISTIFAEANMTRYSESLSIDRGSSGQLLTPVEIEQTILLLRQMYDDDLTAKDLVVADIGYDSSQEKFSAAIAFWKAKIYMDSNIGTELAKAYV